ncbi:MAG: LPS-assembly protein LptD [Candidatus Omnitrophica bacterium]|nr:LPS-assembly protein LptD [Candidatus Omnitrophota bacterium]
MGPVTATGSRGRFGLLQRQAFAQENFFLLPPSAADQAKKKFSCPARQNCRATHKIYQAFSIFFLLFTIHNPLSTISWAAEDISNIPVEVNGDQVEYFDADKKVIGRGNVVVTYKDIRMTCRHVTAYLDSKEATAEGDVVITRGDSVLKGEKIVYNFEHETGSIINGVAKSDVWYSGGRQIKKTTANEIEITDGYITTCDLARPHYKIHSRHVRIYMGRRIVAKNVTLTVAGAPVMYLPVYSQPLKENFPKVNLVPGRDKKWGNYLLSSYRYNLSDDRKGNLHLDYRNFKGLASGVDYNYKSQKFGGGNLRTYYMDERDRVAHSERQRWRAQYRHKWRINPDTTAVMEYHRASDKDFIKDYFYREEFEREPQPSTLISLIHARPGYTANILAKKRVNRFFTETEQLPEAEFNVKNQRLIERLPFFYKADFDAANLNRKDAGAGGDNNVIRADAYNQLSAPLRAANFLSVDPYMAARQTFYSREAQTDKARARGALYYGLDVSANFYRIYNARSGILNLDIEGLRHIFTPNVSFFNVQRPTLARERIFEFDEIDRVDRKKGIGFAFENKLQTKRREKNELNTVDFARWFVETDYLLHLDEGRRFSDVSSDLELRPYTWLYLRQAALYDPKWKDLKSLNTDVVAADKNEKWRLGLGHRYEEKASSQLTTEIQTSVIPKWKFRVFERYEFRGTEFKEQEYTITRDLHCWEADFTYSVRDAHTFWLIFRLKAFPEMPLKLGTSYYKPRAGGGAE